MSVRHFPRFKDKVHDARRVSGHVNGYVLKVLFDDGPDEVLVRFDDGIEAYDYDEFRYTWTDAYQGTFLLAQPSKAQQANEELSFNQRLLLQLRKDGTI